MQSPPVTRYLVPPRSKYSPQHLILSADSIVHEIVWACQDGHGKSRPNRNSIPDHPARSEPLSQPTLSQRITFTVTAVTFIRMTNSQSKKEHDPQPYITCSSPNQFPRLFAFPLTTNTRPAICWSQIYYTQEFSKY